MINTIFKRHWPLILILLLTTSVYANSLTNGFVSDDFGTLSKAAAFLKNPLDELHSAEAASPSFYLTFPINYLLSGSNPLAFHLTNLILYLFVILFLYRYLSELYPRGKYWITLIFALHPIHTEAVSFISARSYLLYSIFFLLSLIYYSKWKRGGARHDFLLSLLFAALSLSSSPFAVTLPAIILTIEILYGNIKENWSRVFLFVLLSFVISFNLYARGLQKYTETTKDLFNSQGAKFSDRYNKILLLPTSAAAYLNLTFLLEKPAYSHQTQTNMYSATIISLLGLITLVLFKLKDQKRFRLSVFFLLFFFVTISPGLNPFTANPHVADRYFLLPSLGIISFFFLALDYACLSGLAGSKQLKGIYTRSNHSTPLMAGLSLKGIFSLLLIVFLVTGLYYQTYLRNQDWRNEKKLFLANVKTDFYAPYPHFRLGSISAEERQLPEAEFHFKMATLLLPSFFAAHRELGKVYLLRKEFTKSRSSLEQAYKLNSSDFETNVFLQVLEDKGY